MKIHTHGHLSVTKFLDCNSCKSFLRFSSGQRNKARDKRLFHIWYPQCDFHRSGKSFPNVLIALGYLLHIIGVKMLAKVRKKSIKSKKKYDFIEFSLIF